MKRFLLLLGVAACTSKSGSDTPAPQPAATALYRVTFEAAWSPATHPGNYPSGAHFSPLIGASHRPDAESRLFAAGMLAGLGIKDMAERGDNRALRTEINALIGQGRAFQLLDGRAAFNSPGTATDTLRLSLTHPAATVVTMVAPSPDWFAALEAENLLGPDGWATTRRVPAIFYDAGTDSGPTYTAPDQPSTPAEPVRTAMPGAAPFGYFVLERIK